MNRFSQTTAILYSCVLLAAGALCEPPQKTGTPKEPEALVYLKLEFTDGTTIHGYAVEEPIPFFSGSLGRVNFRFGAVESLTVPAEGGATTVEFTNGEVLKGAHALSKFELRTAVGKLSLPLDIITRVETATPKSGAFALPEPPKPGGGEAAGMQAGAAKEIQHEFSLALDLQDGSRLIGSTSLRSLKLRMMAEAEVEVAAKKIRQVQIAGDRETAKVTFHNGDAMTGVVITPSFAMQAIFGEVRVPITQVSGMRIVAPNRVLIRDGLLAFHSFNGDANDESGSKNDGQVIGADQVADRFGNEKGAYRFNGRDSEICIKDSESFASLTSFTIAVWLKNASGGTVMSQGGWCSNNGRPDKGLSFVFGMSDQRSVYLNVYGVKGPGRNIPYNELVSFGLIPKDYEWHLVVATFDKGEIALYIDGKADKAVTRYYDRSSDGKRLVDATMLKQMYDSSDQIRIGCMTNYCGNPNGKATQQFTGEIDELLFYSRALDDAEILLLYSHPRGVKIF